MISTGLLKMEVRRMQVEMAWRDERVNVFALSGVSMGIHLEPQLFVCKKRPIGHRGPFVLDPRKGRPRFQLSQLGTVAQEKANEAEYPLSYVAEVDNYLHIPVNYAVFAGLCAEGWFSLWNPSAPLSYFEDLHDGYLALMRVSHLDAEIPEQLLEHGRSGANFIYYLDPPVTVQKLHPVLRPDMYERRKGDLMAFLSEHDWLLGEEGPTASGELETESLFSGIG
ncbi:MAG: hypothetical protein WAW16_00625 [Candidatus Cryosericum sp.]